MLRITVTANEKQAKEYFERELSRQDYYSEGQTTEGKWFGRASEILGLEGTVTKEHFHALCENRFPAGRKSLTQKNLDNRRVFFDFNFSVPKSVSILYGLTRNEKILQCFHNAVHETMSEIEQNMQVRVRTKGQNTDRTTGNMVYSMFTHETARPVEGTVDPHLHVHCTVFNASYDSVERKWKAAEIGQIKKDAPYYQAAFLNRLACSVKNELGFGVVTDSKGQFEIAGFTNGLLEKYSRRTKEIERIAEERGITSKKIKAELGAKTRKAKLKDDSFSVLQKEWVSRLSKDDKNVLGNLDKHASSKNPNDLIRSYDHAIKHSFERKSVLRDKQLWTAVLIQGVGALDVEQVKNYQHPDLLWAKISDLNMVSTKEVLEEEQKMLAIARYTKGTCIPLNDDNEFFKTIEQSFLNDNQQEAVKHLLSSTSRISVLSGAAGVGKTTTLNEVKKGIEQAGKSVFAVAPSSDATEILSKEGFNAYTLQRMLMDKRLQEQMKGQVVIIDEAGLVSVGQMKSAFEFAQRSDVRIILSGDTGQLNSVERGDAMYLLQKTGVIESYRLDKVVRQKGSYKQATEALSKGFLEKGFDIIDKDLRWVREHKLKEIAEKVALKYVQDMKFGSCLVITPTHKEAEEVTEKIRDKLKDSGQIIAATERDLVTVTSLNLTEAEKEDYRNYVPGDAVIFSKNYGHCKKGMYYEIVEATPGGVFLRSESGSTIELPQQHTNHFSVFKSQKKRFSEHDKIRITSNGKTKEGNRLINGANYTIAGFTNKGEVILNNGWTLGKSFRHFTHGYVTTAHASQGKTVDKAIVLYSNMDKGAINTEGFYVALSRARQRCDVFTTDKAALRKEIERSSLRLSASEISNWVDTTNEQAAKKLKLLRFLHMIRRKQEQRSPVVHNRKAGKSNPSVSALKANLRNMNTIPVKTNYDGVKGTNERAKDRQIAF